MELSKMTSFCPDNFDRHADVDGYDLGTEFRQLIRQSTSAAHCATFSRLMRPVKTTGSSKPCSRHISAKRERVSPSLTARTRTWCSCGRHATASMRMRSPASSRVFQRFRRRTPRRQSSGSLVAVRGSVSGRCEQPVIDAVAHDDREPGTTW
jgi:hypothetical protein